MKRTLKLLVCAVLTIAMFSSVAMANVYKDVSTFTSGTDGWSINSGGEQITVSLENGAAKVMRNVNDTNTNAKGQVAKDYVTYMEKDGVGKFSFDITVGRLLEDLKAYETAFGSKGITGISGEFWTEDLATGDIGRAQWHNGSNAYSEWFYMAGRSMKLFGQNYFDCITLTEGKHNVEIEIDADWNTVVRLDGVDVIGGNGITPKHTAVTMFSYLNEQEKLKRTDLKFRGWKRPLISAHFSKAGYANDPENAYNLYDNITYSIDDFAYSIVGINEDAYADGALVAEGAIETVEVKKVNQEAADEITVVVGVYQDGVLVSASLTTAVPEEGIIYLNDAVEIPSETENCEVRVMVLDSATAIAPLAEMAVY